MGTNLRPRTIIDRRGRLGNGRLNLSGQGGGQEFSAAAAAAADARRRGAEAIRFSPDELVGRAATAIAASTSCLLVRAGWQNNCRRSLTHAA
jgi:hypothetical protein